MTSAPAARSGWLGALRDERIGRTLSGIHRHPERSVSVNFVAAEAGMSRSAYAARFAELVGEPPMRYATRWRMNMTMAWLREEESSVSEVAYRLNYRSDAAFSRAVKRVTGVSPGAVRRRAVHTSRQD